MNNFGEVEAPPSLVLGEMDLLQNILPRKINGQYYLSKYTK
jgi:hypothetical protein